MDNMLAHSAGGFFVWPECAVVSNPRQVCGDSPHKGKEVCMSIYLVQHGLSLPKDVDPQKGLSDEGRADVKRIAGVAQGYGIQVAKILHSGKSRAQQTAEIFAEYLSPAGGVDRLDGLKPLDDVVPIASTLDPHSNTMYVGHLPFMERLAAFLLTGSHAKPVFKFQNGGIVSLYEEADLGSWVIKWALMPKID